jgi:hypothetical protein
LTLDCERWTLTHSSAWAAVPVGLGLVLALGLAAMEAASEAEAVAEAEVWDDDGEAEPGWVGEPVLEGDPVPEGELDPEGEPEADDKGDAGLLGFVLAAEEFVLAAGELDTEVLGEAEVEEEADGEGGGDGGCSVGVGEGVLAAGSTSHLVSVFAPALVEVPGLGEAAPSFTVPARATPGQPASTPRVRKTPASTLRTVVRTYARRMKIALLIGITLLFVGFGGDWVTDGYG